MARQTKSAQYTVDIDPDGGWLVRDGHAIVARCIVHADAADTIADALEHGVILPAEVEEQEADAYAEGEKSGVQSLASELGISCRWKEIDVAALEPIAEDIRQGIEDRLRDAIRTEIDTLPRVTRKAVERIIQEAAADA